jgi:hypothetical protein
MRIEAYKRLALAVLSIAARDADKGYKNPEVFDAERFISSDNARIWARVVTMLSPRQPRRYVL